MTGQVTLVFAVAVATFAAASTAAADAKKGDTAAVKAKGEPAETVTVFPFEGVNVAAGVVRAASEVLESALLEQGFEVLEWEPARDRLAGEDQQRPDEPAGEPPPSAEPAEPSTPAEPSPASAAVAPSDGSPPPAPTPGAVVSHATPPPPPGQSWPVTSGRGFPVVVGVQPLPVPVEPPIPELSAALKREIAEELGVDFYVDGSLVKLGSKVRVTVNKRSIAGVAVDTRLMEAKTNDDLVTVLERISRALARNLTVEETLDLDNATRAETQDLPERFRLEKNFGAIIGQAFGVDDTMRYYTMFGFDVRLELNDVLVELNPGFASGEDDTLQLLLNIGVGYYLTHTPVSPYIGVGAGVFFGDRLECDDVEHGPLNGDDEGADEESDVGFEAFPMVGVEFLRHSAIRVHLDLRYSFSFSPNGDFGHGPVALLGVNF
jgi:hypothetical protein